MKQIICVWQPVINVYGDSSYVKRQINFDGTFPESVGFIMSVDPVEEPKDVSSEGAKSACRI